MRARLPFDEPRPAAFEAAGESGEAIELVVVWNGSMLEVRHLDLGAAGTRPFRLGERPGCDLALPLERLGGRDEVRLVRRAGDRLVFVLPAGSSGVLRRADGVELSFEELERSGRSADSAELPGAREVVPGPGERLRVEFGEYTFLARGVPRARLALARQPEWTALGFVAASLALHVAFLALAWRHEAAPEGLRVDALAGDRGWEQLIALAPPQAVRTDAIALEESAEQARRKAEDRRVEEAVTKEPDEDDDGGTGAAAAGPEGRMGERSAPDEDKMGGVRGPADNPDPHMARTKFVEHVMETGALAALSQLDRRAPTSMFSPYSTALGNDPVDARGHLMGSDYGDAWGEGGLGMFGSGDGGGGSSLHGFGLGLDGMGHGYGTGSGIGFGREAGRLGRRGDGEGSGRPGPELRGRTGSGPEIRLLEATTFGGLSKETIQRIVRAHRSRIRHCYEIALRESAEVMGRVTVGFVIAPQGNVQSAEARANTTQSEALARCVVGVVQRISFPQADGITACTYPFLLQTAGAEEE